MEDTGKKPYTLVVEVKSDHLSVRASGQRTRESVTAMTLEVFEAVLAHRLQKAMIDVRDLPGRLTTLDSYLLVTEVFNQIRGKGLRRAAIVDLQISPLRGWFLETVARNRGFNFRIFPEPEEAVAWLRED